MATKVIWTLKIQDKIRINLLLHMTGHIRYFETLYNFDKFCQLISWNIYLKNAFYLNKSLYDPISTELPKFLSLNWDF